MIHLAEEILRGTKLRLPKDLERNEVNHFQNHYVCTPYTLIALLLSCIRRLWYKQMLSHNGVWFYIEGEWVTFVTWGKLNSIIQLRFDFRLPRKIFSHQRNLQASQSLNENQKITPRNPKKRDREKSFT